MLEIKLIILLVFCLLLSVCFFINAVKDKDEKGLCTYCIIYAYPDTEDVEYKLREINSTLSLRPEIILVDFGLEAEIMKIFEKMTEGIYIVHVIYPVSCKIK